MIRFAWMQFRLQALVALGGLTIVAIASALTGPHLVHLYDTTVANCSTHSDCSEATSALISNGDKLSIVLKVVVEVVPALIGLFWGAPLVAQEIETGTYRLAWTQVTRTRWMGFKLGLLGLASVVVAGVLSLMVTWWSSPLDRVRMTPFTSFDQRDLVPIGYAVFALVFGATVGMLVRRTLPAMATALGGFVVARLVVAHFGRPRLLAPLRVVVRDTVIATGSSVGTSDPRLDHLRSDDQREGTGDRTVRRDRSEREHDRQRRRSRDHRQGSRVVSQPPHPDSTERSTLCRPSPDTRGADLPADRPLLGAPMGRVGDLPRCLGRLKRVLHLVGQKQNRMTQL